jgi:tetratricopeptide (TPR) repeat protein
MSQNRQIQTRMLWAALLLAGLAFVAYFPALRGGFVFDDDTLVTKNAMVQAPDGLYRFWFTADAVDYWPMTMTSFWVEWRLWGMDPAGYHVTNLLLHIGSALLVWAILKRLRVPGAYWAALLFAVHPVNVESVAWIAQRKNTLSMIFFLASIYCFVRFEEVGTGGPPVRGKQGTPVRSKGRPGTHGRAGRPSLPINRWYWLSLLAFTLAMLSKGSVAILPLILLGIIAWRRRLELMDLVRAAPFFAVAGVLTLVNIGWQTHGVSGPIRTAGPIERLLEAGATVWFYLSKALLPINLVFFYPLWTIHPDAFEWWLPLLGAIGLTGLLVYMTRFRSSSAVIPSAARNPVAAAEEIPRSARDDNGVGADSRSWRAALFAWGYFCVALIPVMGFADVYFMKYSLVADHYQYLALLGVMAWVSAVWWDGAEIRFGSFRFLAAAGVVALFAGMTFWQTLAYRDAETLYRVTLQRDPLSWPAAGNLGVIEAESSRIDAAFGHFTEALRLNPDYAQAHYNLGRLLKVKPNGSALALPHFARAVELYPEYADAHFWLARCLEDLNRQEEARAQYEQAIAAKTFFLFDSHRDLAVNLAKAGRLAEALPHFEEAARLNPRAAMVHYMLAEDLEGLGRTQEAEAQFTLAGRLDPRLIRPPSAP